jgi:3-deoxy-manno-octulosonate cytidylyltransferase (CMP-KDO synthetase)
VKIAICIPARYASSRYPGKPLVGLRGATGLSKPLIQRSWEAAMAAAQGADVHVLTDDDRIAKAARGFGASVLMTSEAARNGTERCADALAQIAPDTDVIVNLQGDAPLTPPWFIAELVARMANPDVAVATPVLRADPDALANLLADRRAGRVGGTTAVMRDDGSALYFSKEVLPHVADEAAPPNVWHHVGVYAYRPDALLRYIRWGEGTLERAEGLEQLRFLEAGVPVACVPVEARGRVFWELNNPVDVARIEATLAQEGLE